MYTVWHNVCENNYSHIVVCTNNYSHIARKTQCLNNYFCVELKLITKNLQSTEPWPLWPPYEFGKLALGASQAIFDGWGGIRGVMG